MNLIDPQVKVTLTVKDGLVKEYMLGLPTLDQDMAIDALKMTLSQGKYSEMAKGNIKRFLSNLDRIDAASTFAVLIPTLHKDYGYESLGSLTLQQGKELVKQYNDVYEPFYEANAEMLSIV